MCHKKLRPLATVTSDVKPSDVNAPLQCSTTLVPIEVGGLFNTDPNKKPPQTAQSQSSTIDLDVMQRINQARMERLDKIVEA